MLDKIKTDEGLIQDWQTTPNHPGAAKAIADSQAAIAKYKEQLANLKESHNYAIWRDDIISILKKYGLAGLGLAGYGAMQGQGQQQTHE